MCISFPDPYERIRANLMRRHIYNIMPAYRKGEQEVFLSNRSGEASSVIPDERMDGSVGRSIRKQLPDACVISVPADTEADEVAEKTQNASDGCGCKIRFTIYYAGHYLIYSILVFFMRVAIYCHVPALCCSIR